MAYIGVKGIQYVGKVALLLNSIPLVMLIVVFWNKMRWYRSLCTGTGGDRHSWSLCSDAGNCFRFLRYRWRRGC